MPRPRLPVPSYRLHKSSGQAVVTVRIGDDRKDFLLGPYNSPESKVEYRRVLAEASGGRILIDPPSDLTVNELLVKFSAWAEAYYRGADGTHTSELEDIRHAVRPFRELFGLTAAREFGPLALKRVREAMVAKGWARGTVNRQVGRVKRVIRWAVENELVPADRWEALRAVRGLSKGRTEARETDPIGPVPDDVVDATLPFMNRHVRGLVEFQRYTGCRPGEAVVVRRCDIDESGEAWVYKPKKHKTAWRGKTRTILIGPRAQAVLLAFFTPDPSEYLFSARRAVDELRAERSAARTTKRWPSHLKRNAEKRKANPARPPAAWYTRAAYNVAVAAACEKAFPPPPPLAKRGDETNARWRARLTAEQRAELARWVADHRWSVNQLRHTAATKVRAALGIEAAQSVLGHSKPDTTLIYAQRSEALAATAAMKLG